MESTIPAAAIRPRLLYRVAARASHSLRESWRRGVRPACLRLRLRWLAWGAGVDARAGAGLSIGRAVRIFLLPGSKLVLGAGVRLHDHVTIVVQSGATLTIGDRTYVGPWSEIYAGREVSLGSDCLLAGEVVVIDYNHSYDLVSPVRVKETTAAAIIIGDGCWLSTRSILTAGAGVGDFSVVAAGAVVTAPIPAGSVAAGVPARIIRSRE